MTPIVGSVRTRSFIRKKPIRCRSVSSHVVQMSFYMDIKLFLNGFFLRHLRTLKFRQLNNSCQLRTKLLRMFFLYFIILWCTCGIYMLYFNNIICKTIGTCSSYILCKWTQHKRESSESPSKDNRHVNPQEKPSYHRGSDRFYDWLGLSHIPCDWLVCCHGLMWES